MDYSWYVPTVHSRPHRRILGTPSHFRKVSNSFEAYLKLFKTKNISQDESICYSSKYVPLVLGGDETARVAKARILGHSAGSPIVCG